jgi:hypothetical protein
MAIAADLTARAGDVPANDGSAPRALLSDGSPVVVEFLGSRDLETLLDLHTRLSDRDRWLRLARCTRPTSTTSCGGQDVLPELSDVDVNPLVLRERGATAVDVRMRLAVGDD